MSCHLFAFRITSIPSTLRLEAHQMNSLKAFKLSLFFQMSHYVFANAIYIMWTNKFVNCGFKSTCSVDMFVCLYLLN
jgi:hypothetical protein